METMLEGRVIHMCTGIHLVVVGRVGSKSTLPPPNIFFYLLFFFCSTELKRGQENTEIFSERLFGWCIAEKYGNPAFYRPQNRTI